MEEEPGNKVAGLNTKNLRSLRNQRLKILCGLCVLCGYNISVRLWRDLAHP